MVALFVVLAIAVVAGVAVLVLRDRPLISDDPAGSRVLDWSARDGVRPQDLAAVRFAVVLRGYRMDEVDRVLDDTREALADRDARIADLQNAVLALGGTPPADGAAGQDVDEVSAADSGSHSDGAANAGGSARTGEPDLDGSVVAGAQGAEVHQ